ncbi:patatin-like phospholipase family protein [Myxococcus xanthus]|nr:patatin-like phospholipase family protein [Myxococcus xanthus]
MKGGVTSGVVYPPAILELARQYRFRSLGGTSAGAIAAAAAAAAEYGREKNSRPDVGFAGLRSMMEQLQQAGFLLHLFQPAPQARKLFDAVVATITAFNEPGEKRQILQWMELVRKVLQGPDVAAQRGILPIRAVRQSLALMAWPVATMARWASRPVKTLAMGSSLWSLAGVMRRGLDIWQSLKGGVAYVRAKDESFFALCTGMDVSSESKAPKYPALTPWLHEHIQKLAGLDSDDVLTLGRLREKKDDKGKAVGIDFRMVTTNLSQRQPYTLHGEDADASSRRVVHPEELDAGYLFCADDMRRLFPLEVVRYLKNWMDVRTYPLNKTQSERTKAAFENFDLEKARDKGFYPFPAGNALPVVVATRMSLSFPLLLSAVRLYTIRHSVFQMRETLSKGKRPYVLRVKDAGAEKSDLLENWFSDGGISSNFPIHMFDDWLPQRPTFGINLADSQMPTNITGPREASIHRGSDDVFLAQPRCVLTPHVYPLTWLREFLGAIFDTAQNYRDNTQARLPSYRERVAHVRLADGEGGLNLNMGVGTIQTIAEKGGRAAERLRREFGFDEHRWVRLLVLLGRLEEEFFRLRERYENESKNGNWRQELLRQYAALLAMSQENGRGWYRVPQEARWPRWRKEAIQRIEALTVLIDKWTSGNTTGIPYARNERKRYFFAYDEPMPESILRVTPEH